MISVVDDDESIRSGTETLLRSFGYHVRTFASADDFLSSGALGETACLILDVRMPGTDGLALYRRMQADNMRVPTIFITAHDDASLRQRVIDAGAVELLHKPFRMSALLVCVQSALGSAGVER